jgi:hypothetical protein
MVNWHFVSGFVAHAKGVAALEKRRDREIPGVAEAGGPEVRLPKFQYGKAGVRDSQTLQKMKERKNIPRAINWRKVCIHYKLI